MSVRIYLDWNATAPLRPEAHAAMLSVLSSAGNASSLHAEGRLARAAIEKAREEVALLVGAEARNVTFTSGGTEANVMALSPEWGADLAFVSAVEHPSVLAGGRFGNVCKIAVDVNGKVDPAAVRHALAKRKGGGSRALVSATLANNETGVVQPIAQVAEIVHAAGGLLHVDAIQAAGRMPINIKALCADLLTLSAHKIGGPQGVGALVRSDERLHLAKSLVTGGGQERGLRAGTENIAGIVGFGAAAHAGRQHLAAEAARMTALQVKLETGLCDAVHRTVIFGGSVARLPNTTLAAVPGLRAETLLIALDLEGMAVSAGAACSSGKIAASHVLAAMGVEPELANGAIRISTGYATNENDVERFLLAWRKCAATLLKRHEIAA